MLCHLVALVLASAAAVIARSTSDIVKRGTMADLEGTWSSGSMGVVTGAGFANPANESFIYPNTTGISYAFTSDGYYEIARYRYTSNGTSPKCIVGVLNWCHGTYELLSNGSIVMTPFGDGYQQVSNACAATSDFIESYNDTELYETWEIFTDPLLGQQLLLYQYDGTPLAQQNLWSSSPNMLPTQNLRDSSTTTSTTSDVVVDAVSDLASTSAGARTRGSSYAGIVALTVAAASAGVAIMSF